MKSRKSTRIIAIALFATLAIPARLAAQQAQEEKKQLPHYTVTDLGTLGGTFSTANGLDNRDLAAGASLLPGDAVLHAFLWQMEQITDLRTLGGLNSNTAESRMVNDRDMVAGFSETPTPDPNGEDFCGFGTVPPLICLPFVWEKGGLTALPTLGGNNASAGGINNRGEIVGSSETSNFDLCSFAFLQIEAVVWQKGNIQELPPFPGDSIGTATAINDRGQVVGATGCIATNTVRAVLWPDGPNGGVIDLGNLGGTTFNIAFAINNRGQVVGQSVVLPGNILHGFLWQSGVMTDLGSLPGLPTSIANAINNHGQVVGLSQDANGDDSSSVAWIWQHSEITDLNSLIPPDSLWFLMEALGINDRGEIAGFMVNTSTGDIHGFLAIPVEDTENTASAVPLRQRPKILLSEGIRKILRQRLAQRYHFAASEHQRSSGGNLPE